MRMHCHHSLFWLVFLLFSCYSKAQSGANGEPLKTTMCDLYKNPGAYAGRMIQVRATIMGFRAPELEQPSFLPQEPCSAPGYMRIALELPQGVQPRPPFDLIADASFEKYQAALRKPMRIEATLEGRFDPVFIWQNHKRIRISDGKGYGKNHFADGRLVLHKMSDVATWAIPRR